MNIAELNYSEPMDVAQFLDTANNVDAAQLTAALINALRRISYLENRLDKIFMNLNP